jgi:hypothetical protein
VSKLVLKPLAGLANRMRVLNSGLFLGELFDEFEIVWETDDYLNAKFSDLFEPIKKVKIIETKSLRIRNILSFNSYFKYYNSDYVSNEKNRIKQNIVHLLGREKMFDKIIYQSDFYDLSHAGFVFENLSKQKKVFLATCWGFIDTDNYLKFKPIPLLELKIKNIVNQLGLDYLGVHIRRGDHKIATANSPIVFFKKEIKNFLQLYPNSKVFLATDSDSIKLQFQKSFPNKIHIRNNILVRNEPEGIQEALIDLYVLSYSIKIIGSYDSSFSDVASKINNTPLVLPY